ncbi:MAG: hypothetical protein WC858_06340 [Parcubacteria group bacterium]|jgi:hypothetical protein
MRFDAMSFLYTIAYFFILLELTVSNQTFKPSQQDPPLLLPLSHNWPIIFGVPIFAIINGLVVPKLGNLHPIDYVLSGQLGLAATYLFYRDWMRHPNQNNGCIITKEGEITWPGYLHGVYMSFQVPVLYLFIRVHMEEWRVIAVSALFLIFLGLVNLLAYKFQGGLSKWQLFWHVTGTIAVAAFKLW